MRIYIVLGVLVFLGYLTANTEASIPPNSSIKAEKKSLTKEQKLRLKGVFAEAKKILKKTAKTAKSEEEPRKNK